MTRREEYSVMKSCITEIVGFPVKSSIVAKHYGVSCNDLRESLLDGTVDRQRFIDACNKGANETQKCLSCYYCGGNFACCYPLFNDDILTENWVSCPRYKKGEPDYDERKGCGNCFNYEPFDLLSGFCAVDGERVKSYTPACKGYEEVAE